MSVYTIGLIAWTIIVIGYGPMLNWLAWRQFKD